MRKNKLAGVISFLVLSCLFIACGSVKEPEFLSIQNVRVSEISMNESTFSLDLLYHNPNKFRVKLKEATGGVWFDGQWLGNFSIDTLIHIPAAADFRLPLKLKANMGQLLQNSLVLFLKKDISVRLEGNARIGKGIVFVSYPIRYEGKHTLVDLLR